MMVFKYYIVFEGDDILTDRQVRYVLAHEEEEADRKMERYRKQLVKQGFMDFRYINKGIELYTVIA